MTYVDLPELELTGEWTVTPAERVLAARLLELLPAPPPPGADARTRWLAVESALNTVSQVIRDGGDELFAERGGSVAGQDGVVTMIDLPFAVARWFNEAADRHRLVASMRGDQAANAVLERLTAEIEPEVAELRRLLAVAANG